ncbi:Ribosomal RNA small subunit methyltransferase B [Candidatus Magnetobacterium bavaricum]|uniref:16S rRNA (cytosine(967)-C(5))-methyltransferase n=1 Tax=Candidatus Magnetobacterium bavaricum TaxID=29290 RepID=A0A0F3H0T1_9BACT|nr:Ribosomal RNA small subunit methyltransferase B [Candidatus Magnetobacterium bavaricum]
MKGKADSVRLMALRALDAVATGKGLPKDVMEQSAGAMEQRDRAFLMELVYGVLRYRDTLDWMLRAFLKKPAGLKPFTMNNLRLAVYQITHMRVPDWAAVNESVEIEKTFGKHALVVNGVLRQFLRNRHQLLIPSLQESPLQHIVISTSHPQWLIERWLLRFGADRALSLALANNNTTTLTLRVNTIVATRDEIAGELDRLRIGYEHCRYSPHGIRLKGHVPMSALGSLKGRVYIQDEASQLVGFLLDPQEGDYCLDACSAPGGKATHMAALGGDRLHIMAVDGSKNRVNRIIQNARDLGIKSITPVVADIRALPPQQREFDKILLDAPCSSLGVIRKNPDIKYRHSEASLKQLSQHQLTLLQAVSGHLKKGGLLVYSVCSTEPDEAEDVVKEFLTKNENFCIINNMDTVKNKYAIDLDDFNAHMQVPPGQVLTVSREGYRAFPDVHQTDGFFFSVMTRR